MSKEVYMIRRITPPVRVLVALLLWVAGCTPTPVTPKPPTNTPTDTAPAPTDTPTEEPTATEPPTIEPTEPPTEEPTATNTPTPPAPTTDSSVFYALPASSPKPGIAYLLTPRQESPGITAEELAANPGLLDGQPLGTLK